MSLMVAIRTKATRTKLIVVRYSWSVQLRDPQYTRLVVFFFFRFLPNSIFLSFLFRCPYQTIEFVPSLYVVANQRFDSLTRKQSKGNKRIASWGWPSKSSAHWAHRFLISVRWTVVYDPMICSSSRIGVSCIYDGYCICDGGHAGHPPPPGKLLLLWHYIGHGHDGCFYQEFLCGQRRRGKNPNKKKTPQKRESCCCFNYNWCYIDIWDVAAAGRSRQGKHTKKELGITRDNWKAG